MHKGSFQNKQKQNLTSIKRQQKQKQNNYADIPLQSLHPFQQKIKKSCISDKYKEKLQSQINKNYSTKSNNVMELNQQDHFLIDKTDMKKNILYQNCQRLDKNEQWFNKVSKNKQKQNNSINLPMQLKQNPYFHKQNKKPQNRPILKLLFESDVSNYQNQIDYTAESPFQQIKQNQGKLKTKGNLSEIASLEYSQIKKQKAFLQSINITQNQSISNKLTQNQSIFSKLTQNMSNSNKLSKLQIQKNKQFDDQQQSMHFYNQSTYRNSQRQELKQEQNQKNQKICSKKDNCYDLKNSSETSSINIATFKPKQLKCYLVQANKNITKQNISKQKNCFSQSQRLKFINNNNQTNQKFKKQKGKTLFTDQNHFKANQNMNINKSKTNKIHDFDYLYQQTKPKTKYQAILDSYFNQNKLKNIKQKLALENQINKLSQKDKNISKSCGKRKSNLSVNSYDFKSTKNQNKHGSIHTQTKLYQIQDNQQRNLKKNRSQSCSSLRKNTVAYYKKEDIYPQEIQKLQKTYSKASLNNCQKTKMKTQPIQIMDIQQRNCNSNSARWMSLNFYERQQKLIQNRKQKQEIGKKQKSIKEVNNCTFKPKLTQFKVISTSRQNSTTYAKMYLQKLKKRNL